MTMPFDISLFVTVLSFIVLVLSGLIFIGKDNLIILIQKGVTNEMSKIYAGTLNKSERYCHGVNVTGRKLKIKRRLGKVRREYAVPKGILAISGLSAIGWLLCFTLALEGFVMSGTGNMNVINVALLNAQYCLMVMMILAWFCSKTRVEYPMLFLLLCGLLWIIATAAAFITTVLGWFFPVIPSEHISIAFIVILIVPSIPIIIAIVNIVCYLFREYNMYRALRAAVVDFEKYRNDSARKK